MARRSNHNDGPKTAPTWADILTTMRYMQGEHKCFVTVQTGVSNVGPYAGEMYVEARAVDWNDGVGGRPIELFRVNGWARQYSTYAMCVYVALTRLDGQLDDRWKWGGGEQDGPHGGK